jgi:hypothetical protein
MKKYLISDFAVLLVLIMTFQFANAQKPTKQKDPKLLEITMTIDFEKWNEGDRYEAITFRDSDEIAENRRNSIIGKQDRDSIRRGRPFDSKVKRNQTLKWRAEFKNKADSKDKKIVLISVVSDPNDKNPQLLTETWYNGQYDDSNASYESNQQRFYIEGKTKSSFKGGAKQQYIISFAITNGEWYSIYTIDPIITGHL